jgi:hypothetical protein
VVALVAVVAPIAGPRMPDRGEPERQSTLDAENEVMVELIPARGLGPTGGSGTVQTDRKVIR